MPIFKLFIHEFGDSTETWLMYGKWNRQTKTIDESPNAAQ